MIIDRFISATKRCSYIVNTINEYRHTYEFMNNFTHIKAKGNIKGTKDHALTRLMPFYHSWCL